MVKTSAGFAARIESTAASIRAVPSISLPYPEAQVEHQWEPPGLCESDGVIDRAHHAAGGGDAALGAVGDLEPEQLGAGRDSVESGDPVHVVPGCDARDVRAVAEGVEHEIELRVLAAGREVDARFIGGGRPRRPSRTLSRDQVVVHRPLAGERAIAIGVGEEHPPVGGAGDHQRRACRVALPLPFRSEAGGGPSGISAMVPP